MKRKPEPLKAECQHPEPALTTFEELCMVVGFLVLIAGVGGVLLYGIYSALLLAKPNVMAIFDKPPERLPGELVDKAMALPGAIVISPHRDLTELGIVKKALDKNDEDTPIFVTSPTIAVHTGKGGWCLWELGADGSFRSPYGYIEEGLHYLEYNVVKETGSYDGYQTAYDNFTKCVAEGK